MAKEIYTTNMFRSFLDYLPLGVKQQSINRFINVTLIIPATLNLICII